MFMLFFYFQKGNLVAKMSKSGIKRRSSRTAAQEASFRIMEMTAEINEKEDRSDSNDQVSERESSGEEENNVKSDQGW